MGSYTGAMVYNKDVSTEITVASPATPARAYTSLAAALATINASGVSAVAEEFPGEGEGKPIRLILSATIKGVSPQTANETLYGVIKTSQDGVDGIELVNLGTVIWTAGPTAAPAAQGGRTGHVYPSSVSLSSTGLLENLTGRSIGVNAAEAASLTIFDVGPLRAIVRCCGRGGATGITPRSMPWR